MVADDDTTPEAVPVEGGEMVTEAIAVADAILLLVVVGDTVFDVTDAAVVVDTIGIADTLVVVETAVPTEATVLPEAIIVVDAIGTIMGADEAILVADSVEAMTVAVTIGTAAAIVVAVRRGGTELVDVIEAILVEAIVAEEAVVVFTTDMIGATTFGDVVRTKTAATGG